MEPGKAKLKNGVLEGVASVSPSVDSSQDLAKQLSNPVASLISVPIQSNWDFGMGPNGDGIRWTTNIQPVIPFTLNEDWNLISRTILPIVYQDDVIGTSSQGGLSDTVQSFFFSPNKTDPFIWGAGPAFLLPTATDNLLGTEKFGVGPTLVILKQTGGWTYGVLSNHLFSVGGNADRSYVSQTFVQPFLAYTTQQSTTYAVNSESTYDWRTGDWNIPLNFTVAQLFKVGGQPLQAQIGVRYYADSPANGPDWGMRATLTMLFPRK